MKNLVFILLLFPVFLSAQLIRVKGTIIGVPPEIGEKMVLEQFVGEEWQKGDFAQLATDGYFQFPARQREPGLYRIGFPREGHPIEFIIGPADSVYSFQTSFQTMLERKCVPQNNRESQAWERWKPIQDRYGYRRMMNVYSQQFSPEGYPQILREIADVVAALKLEFPNTYTTTVLTTFLPQTATIGPGKTPAAYFSAYILRRLPWENPYIFRNKYFKEILDSYAILHQKAGLQGIALCDTLMPLVLANEQAASYVYKYLLMRFINTQDDPSARYLLNSYSPGCTDEGDPLAVNDLITSMKRCATGNLVPDLQLPTAQGQLLQLSDYYRSHRLTLLMFWKSNCSHCQEHWPEVAALYQELAGQGFGVYAASTDGNPAEWQQFLVQHPAAFANVLVTKPVRQAMTTVYPLISTPYMLLIDQQGKIVNPMVSPKNLATEVRTRLTNGG